jgi:predicted AlkP superfamily pyrophosphatase or phosphodiesterase
MRTVSVNVTGAALAAVLVTAAVAGQGLPASQRGLVLISIDGLPPDYVIGPARQITIPNLRRILKEGVHASGVRGVLPTSTYPSHTTVITGAHPATHGIESNKPFDPFGRNPDEWHWYSEDIRVPTLWEAAVRGGYVTGNVAWPVTVGAPGIRFNIPEYAGTRSDADL